MPTILERLTAIEQQLAFNSQNQAQAHEDRKELLGEIKELSSAMAGLRQAFQSSQNVLTRIAEQSPGDRLDELEEGRRIANAEFIAYKEAQKAALVNYKDMETDFLFWKKVLGGGFALLWKIVAMVTASGLFGALATKWIK